MSKHAGAPRAQDVYHDNEDDLEYRRAGDSDFTSVKIHQSGGWADGGGGAGLDTSRSFCARFKFAIWAIVATALVAAMVGLSITMAVVKSNDDKSASGSGGLAPDPSRPSAPPPPPSPGAKPVPSPPPADNNGQMVVMTNPPFAAPPGWTALWWDEFAGDALDPRWWNVDTGYGASEGLWAWGNLEEQFYTGDASNLAVKNGALGVTAQRQDTVLDDGYTFKYTSGRINSRGKVGVFGGMTTSDGRKWGTVRVEASIKAPQPTQGLWAAFWMLPVDLRYGVWASSGEIDVYEMKNEFDHVNLAFHYGGPAPKYNKRNNVYPQRPGGGTFSQSYATVALDWTPTSMSMSVDGEELHSFESKSVASDGWYSLGQSAGPNAPFDIPFYFIINLTVGGKYPGNTTASSIFPNTLLIDYIRVYGKP